MTGRRTTSAVLGVTGVLVTLVPFEVISKAGIVSARDVPPPSKIIAALSKQVVTGEFWTLVWQTALSWGAALGISVLIAVPSGMLIGSSQILWHALRPTIEFLRPVPGIALIPLVVLLFGTAARGAIVLGAFGCLWALLIQAIYGIREVNEVARDTARSFRFPRGDRIRFLVLPSTLPYIATGIRIASAVALIIVITAELLIGSPGLGKAIALSQNSGAFTKMYALIVAAGVFGLLVNQVFSSIERRLLRWHPAQRVGVDQ